MEYAESKWSDLEPLARAAGEEAMAAWRAGDRAALGRALLPGTVALIGFMGVGKSTVSAALARLLAVQAVDTDQMIEQQAGMCIPDLFARYGEAYFRDLETAAVYKAAGMPHTVISCGGGAVLRPQNVAALQAGGTIVLLTARPETVLARVADDDTRPKLRGKKTVADIAALMEQREPAYRAAAQRVIATDGRSAEQIALELLAALQGRA